MAGWIYIASNISQPGLVKIGFSTNQPSRFRIPDLGRVSGVPTPFTCEYEALVEDEVLEEKRLHRAFEKYSAGKEHFRMSVEEAIIFAGENCNPIKEYVTHVSREELASKKAAAEKQRKDEADRQQLEKNRLAKLKNEQAQIEKLRQDFVSTYHIGLLTKGTMSERLRHIGSALGYLFAYMFGGIVGPINLVERGHSNLLALLMFAGATLFAYLLWKNSKSHAYRFATKKFPDRFSEPD